MRTLEELSETTVKKSNLPKWVQVLSEAGLDDNVKYFVLLQVLGVSDEEAFVALSPTSYGDLAQSMIDGRAERTVTLLRSVFFKKPEDELALLTRRAIEVKRQLLEDPTVPLAIKDKTATDVIDRNIGKAAQTVQIKGTLTNVNVDLSSLDKDLELTLRRIEQLEAPMKSVRALEAPKTL